MRIIRLLLSWIFLNALALNAAELSNRYLKVELGDRGLVALFQAGAGEAYHFTQDNFSISIDGRTYDSSTLPAPRRRVETDRVVYVWDADSYRFEVAYEVRPDWQFVGKQISIVDAAVGRFRIDDVTVFREELAEPIADVYVPKSVRPDLGTGDYGGCLRFSRARGLLAVVQNPFLAFTRDQNSFAIRYKPEMDWAMNYGAFTTDRGLLAPYRLSGRKLPSSMRPEWRFGAAESAEGMDEVEVEAFTECVRSLLLHKPAKPLNIFVGWCVNDYQIDVATSDGRAEYKRVLDRAAELGAAYVLYAPTNSDLSRRTESADDWSWENLLWLGLGQKIRKNEWNPRSGTVPSSIREMLDYARSKNLKLVAYVYPVLPFTQNPEWLTTRRGNPSRRYASLGVKALQDWLIDSLTAFYDRTGIGGFSFDHTFLSYDGTSRYAQWWGWRRTMEELRRRIPDIVIDGRQSYHLYGPWSWLAGSYPHPTFNDEQPESFVPFPDLHFDRVSADHQRFTSYRYRNYDFAPSEIVPGFITHQTSRSDDSGDMPQIKSGGDTVLTRFRARDWDYLGWRYSLLSSIATGGWNNVINMIPARDPDESRLFPEQDKQWFRHWLQWTEKNKEYLRHARTILGEPALGKVDGTAAILDDHGCIFLFNPNGRGLSAEFPLDPSIGLTRQGKYLLSELHPREGLRIGKPGAGVWAYGDRVSIPMDGGSATVIELQPAPASITEPLLFNGTGSVSLSGGTLGIAGLRGEPGESRELLIMSHEPVRTLRVNGRNLGLSHPAENIFSCRVTFAGTRFGHYQQIGAYDTRFSGGTFSTVFSVPRRIFDQLAARRKAWPIRWTQEDYRTTWLVSDRLLLFVQLAEPDDRWDARLRIDGRPVELKKAYSAVRVVRSTFVGFYADVSFLAPDREHKLELQLPQMKPGQFQGVFFENVEPEYTDRIQ